MTVDLEIAKKRIEDAQAQLNMNDLLFSKMES